jgi:hypothetical protein
LGAADPRTLHRSPRAPASRYFWWRLSPGEVAERLNAPVSKTGMGDSSIGGSNPPLSVL